MLNKLKLFSRWSDWRMERRRRRDSQRLVSDLHDILRNLYAERHSNADQPSDVTEVKKYKDGLISIHQFVYSWRLNGEACQSERLSVYIGNTPVLVFQVDDTGGIVSDVERPGAWMRYVGQLAEAARIKQETQRAEKEIKDQRTWAINHTPVDDGHLF